MSERERIKQVIDRLPEYKLAYVSNLILSIMQSYKIIFEKEAQKFLDKQDKSKRLRL